MKENIVRQTFRLILEKGINSVSISDIQNATGISRALIYHYFSNKDELVLEALKTYFFLKYKPDETDMQKIDFRSLMLHTINVLRSIEKELLIDSKSNGIMMSNYNSILYQSIRMYPEFIELLNQYEKDAILVIKNAQKNKEIKKEIDAKFIYNMFLYIFDGAANYYVSEKKNNFYSYIKRDMENFYNIIKI